MRTQDERSSEDENWMHRRVAIDPYFRNKVYYILSRFRFCKKQVKCFITLGIKIKIMESELYFLVRVLYNHVKLTFRKGGRLI